MLCRFIEDKFNERFSIDKTMHILDFCNPIFIYPPPKNTKRGHLFGRAPSLILGLT